MPPSAQPGLLSWVSFAAILKVCSRLERKNAFPVPLHVDDCPALGASVIERLIELPDVRMAIVSPFAFSIGMMYDAHEAGPLASRCPLQHLIVAIRVAEREDRLPSNKAIDA